MKGSDVGPADTAFDVFYSEHFFSLLRYVRRNCRENSVEDVVVDVFTVAWRRFHDIPADHAFAWLIGTARHTLANQYRSERRREALVAKVIVSRPRAVTVQADERVPIDSMAAICSSFAALSDADQEILRLVAVEQFTVEDLAVALGVSAGTASVRLFRARSRLRVSLRQNGEESFDG